MAWPQFSRLYVVIEGNGIWDLRVELKNGLLWDTLIFTWYCHVSGFMLCSSHILPLSHYHNNLVCELLLTSVQGSEVASFHKDSWALYSRFTPTSYDHKYDWQKTLIWWVKAFQVLRLFEIPGLICWRKRRWDTLLSKNRASMLRSGEIFGGYCIYKKLEMSVYTQNPGLIWFYTIRQNIAMLKQKGKEEVWERGN